MSGTTEILLGRMAVDSDYREHMLATPPAVFATIAPNDFERTLLTHLHPFLVPRPDGRVDPLAIARALYPAA